MSRTPATEAGPNSRVAVAPLGDRAYLQLRELIVHGTYRPNQRIVEEELAERLGISRTPVRSALQKLFDQRLVGRDRAGWYVWEHTTDDIREIYEVRTALEGYASRLAAQRASAEDVAELKGIYDVDTVEELMERYSREELVALNSRFHETIVRISGNQRLYAQCQTDRQLFFTYRLAKQYTDEQMLHSARQHLAILAAIEEHNGDLAEAVSREHVVDALALLVDFRESFG